MGEHDAQENTDRMLLREDAGTLFVTAAGGIGIEVGGLAFVKSLSDWHMLALFAAEEDYVIRDGPQIPEGSITPDIKNNAFLSMLAKPKGEG